MLSKKLLQLSCLLCLLSTAELLNGANFTYDGINRRDPLTVLEQNTINATGKIFCNDAKTGRQKVSTGFFLDLGQDSEHYLLIASGHSFRDASDNEYHSGCLFRPYGSEQLFALDNNVTGDLAQTNPAVYIKNDWGVSILASATGITSNAIPLSNRTYQELHNLLQAGLGEIKFYGGNLIPDQGEARIQISDNCSIWQPTARAILGSGHSLYTNCDSTGSSSGGALVIELNDGSVEAIGIMFGAIHTVATVNRLLGENASTMTIADIEHAIDIIPSPDTIINIAVPLIPGMREQSLSDLFNEIMDL
ncbi:MAG: hypothetical protein COA71_04350 [SAR86 cluster bacterium]|uniref:Serine protease n=1 Tax=SAR86 cluster bacterium TaxID=2030880 RepID=A0A2A5CGW3_9GAMM|nr:MAG: hypothetical protein COA71_04350 [SAR86 cluster bacterium]